VLAEMITQPTVPDAGADGTDPSAAGARRADGAVSPSMILQPALQIIDRDVAGRVPSYAVDFPAFRKRHGGDLTSPPKGL
jgi:hypothetical protein